MEMVDTIYGPMYSEKLERRNSVFEDDNELTKATEYWLDGELVHRSVHVQLKKSLENYMIGEF